jgi:hypothetical protein
VKLWLLQPRDDKAIPWQDWWNGACFGMVVVARTEEEAREIASKEAEWEQADAWLYPKFSSCQEVQIDQLSPQVLLKDVKWD